MSWISREFFASSHVMFGPLIALIIFIGIFSLICYRAFSGQRAEVQKMAQLVLEPEQSDLGGRHG